MPANAYLLAVLLLLAAISRTGYCYEDGAPAAHTGGFGEPDCSLCHSDSRKNPTGGTLKVAGLPQQVVPGDEYQVSVVLQHEELRSGGFQLALRQSDGSPAGKIVSLSPRTQVVSGAGLDYLQHAKEGLEAEEEGIIRWAFRWIAAGVTGPVHLHVAANASNDDASALGDYIFTLERVLPAETPWTPR